MTAPIFTLRGTPSQNGLVQRAVDRCEFDFGKLRPSLTREGRSSVNVDWQDLSRYGQQVKAAVEADQATVPVRAHEGEVHPPKPVPVPDDGHDHEHVVDEVTGAVAHPIERVIDGRRAVLGLFYLPPHTRIVLDLSLERNPALAQEVFLAEAAHLVDYHYMTREHRRLFINAVHRQQLPPGADTADGVAFNLDGHTCSWFDVNSYAWWVGEAFMEGFCEATSDVPVTIQLRHPVGAEDRAVIRGFLGIVDAPTPEPAPEPTAPTPTAGQVYQGSPASKVFHDSHSNINAGRWFDSAAAAVDAGLRPCKVCRPA